MKHWPWPQPLRAAARHRSLLALAAIALLALPASRAWLEASMSRHMLVQMPALAAAGFIAARGLPPGRRARLRRWAGGPWPLVLVAGFASSYWMLPRAMDAALSNPWAELAKFSSLPLLVGAPLALAWERLGSIARGFVWTNFLSMLAVLGWLYVAAPVRVCNSYLQTAQYEAGMWMVWLAIGGFLGWLVGWLAGPPARADGVAVPPVLADGARQPDPS